MTYLDLIKQYRQPKYWPTWFGLGVFRLLIFLPLPVLAFIGYILGLLVYLVHFSRRRIARINLRLCFPEYSKSKIEWINLRHFCYLGQSAITVCMNWWISERRLLRLVEIREREAYDEARKAGKNIIFLMPHFFALDASGLVLTRKEPAVSMYQYMKNPILNQMSIMGRTRFCEDPVLIERKAPLRTLIRAIRKGYPFFYLPDQDAMRKGVMVPFFHRLASTTPALGKIVKTTGAVVIPCRSVTLPWGRGYVAFLGKPIENIYTGDVIADTTTMNRAIEDMIRKSPQNYLWVHKRFKTRPEGESSVY